MMKIEKMGCSNALCARLKSLERINLKGIKIFVSIYYVFSALNSILHPKFWPQKINLKQSMTNSLLDAL